MGGGAAPGPWRVVCVLGSFQFLWCSSWARGTLSSGAFHLVCLWCVSSCPLVVCDRRADTGIWPVFLMSHAHESLRSQWDLLELNDLWSGARRVEHGRLDSSSPSGLLGPAVMLIKPDEVLNQSTVRIIHVGSCMGFGLMFQGEGSEAGK